MVITLTAHEALTPAGKPLAPLTPALLIPVAPVVENVMFGITPPKQNVGDTDAVETVLIGLTLMTALPLTGVVHGLAPVTATLTNV
jgi:hypothetical protein